MKKHIAGIILFIFIVGSSAVIAGLFYQIPEANIVTVRENYIVYKTKKRKRRCRKRRPRNENASVNVHVATFDINRGNGFTALIDYSDKVKTQGEVDLHFFVNDKYGIRFLKTERIIVSTGMDDYYKKMNWMGRLDSRENLYVIPQVHNENDKWTSPEFRSDAAIPVIPNID